MTQPQYGCAYMPAYHGSYVSPAEQQLEQIISTTPPVDPRCVQSVDESAKRKQIPVASGFFDYFPDAIEAVAYLSWAGNEKHNPGEPLHDARGKSPDDADCLQRHFKDRGKWDEIIAKDGRRLKVRHSAAVAWRALRILQKELEADGAPLAPGARNPVTKEI